MKSDKIQELENCSEETKKKSDKAVDPTTHETK